MEVLDQLDEEYNMSLTLSEEKSPSNLPSKIVHKYTDSRVCLKNKSRPRDFVRSSIIDDNNNNTGEFGSLRKLSVSQSCLKVGIQANLLYKLCGPNYQSLNKPVGVAQLPSGKVIVADTFNDRIVMFSKTGKFEKEFATSA